MIIVQRPLWDKKTKAFGLYFHYQSLDRVARCARNAALKKDQPHGGCWHCAHNHLTLCVKAHEASHINKINRQAVVCQYKRLHVQCTMIIVQRPLWDKKTKAFGLYFHYQSLDRVARCARNAALQKDQPPDCCWHCALNHLALCVKAHEAGHINKTNSQAVVGVVPTIILHCAPRPMKPTI